MKFNCSKQLLLDAINIVQRAVSSKSTMPVLEGIHLKCQNNELVLTSNDLELSIVYTIASTVEKEGEIVLNSKIFGEIVRKLPDSQVYIETYEDNKAHIKCQKTDYDIIGLQGEDFPLVPQIEKETSLKISESSLKNMIKDTIFAIALNDSKPILTGILFDIESNILKLVAVDGYRLAMKNKKIDSSSSDMKFVVPGKTLAELMKILSDDDEKVMNIFITDKHILFTFDNFVITSRLLSGEFINYKNIIPTSNKVKINCAVKPFVSCVERASLVTNNDSSKSPLKIEIGKDEIIVSCTAAMAKMEDILEIENITGECMDIGFNYKYLLDALKSCNQEKILMEINGSLNPMIIHPIDENKDEDDFLYMVLPVRINI